jgi:hypothetical protein
MLSKIFPSNIELKTSMKTVTCSISNDFKNYHNFKKHPGAHSFVL